MTPERWTRVKQALATALARAPEDRAAYLEAIGAKDPELGREVESLLAHQAEAEFLEHPAVPAVAAPGPALGPGDMFGQYQIQSVLGEGGMGLVFLAQDRALDRPVALKFLSAALRQQEDARRRFLREAKAAAALDHPYICKIYQTGEEDGHPFIAMEYVRGETLRRQLDTAPMPLKDILRVCMEVAEALETAHAAQIVHRDLKPSNIMLTTGGHVKVLDFGLAKRIRDEVGVVARTMGSELTGPGIVQGTVAYMSPEQVRGQELDVRSDIFSLGVVLYESLTGSNPFQARSLLETASQILHHTPPRLRLIRPDVPAALEQVVHTMLAKGPEERYQSAHDLRTELGRVRDLVDRGDVPVTRPAWIDRSARLLTGRRGVIYALTAGAVAAIAGASAWWAARTPSDPVPSKGLLSVAVMPFANESGDPRNDYLANGIPQAVTTRLHHAGLRVIPWETARRFRNSIATEVAQKLRVDVVLTGHFRIEGDRMVVTPELVDGATGFISWTDAFDGTSDEIFKVQTRIAQDVAAKLGHELTGDAAETLARTESSSADAYDLYLQGAEYLRKGDRDSSDVAYEFFTRALTLDPNLTDAHVGRGAAYLERFWNGWGGGAGNLGLAKKSFEAALQGHAAGIRAQRGLNLIEWYRGRGESHLRSARDVAHLGVDDIETLLVRGEVFTIDGPGELAEPILDRVLALDPWNQAAAWHLTVAYHTMGRFRDAIKAADEYIRGFDHDSYMYTFAANALEQLGDLDGARDRHDRAIEPVMQVQGGPGSVTAYDLNALLFAGTFHSRHGRRTRAEVLWQRGLQLTRTSLSRDPQSIGMRLYSTSFLVVLRDRRARKEEDDAYALAEAADINPLEQRYLASAHAHAGNTGRALEILRYALRRGRLLGRPWVLAPELERADGFADLKRDYLAEEQRRRRLYGPGS